MALASQLNLETDAQRVGIDAMIGWVEGVEGGGGGGGSHHDDEINHTKKKQLLEENEIAAVGS